MKNKYRLLIMVAAFTAFGEAKAQTNDITIQRRCIDQAISTIEDYELMATIGDDETRYAFLELFDDNAVVFNDLLGVSTKDKLTIDEYIKLLTAGLRNRKVTIKNIKSESISRDGEMWKVSMSLDKSISYVNDCGIYFSSEDMFSKDYRLVVNMQYNAQSGQCKITEITGSIDSKKALPANYVVFEKKDPRDNQLLYHGSSMKFNRYNQAFLNGPVTKSDFFYKDPDVTATPIVESECNKLSMVYKARKMRLRLHYDIGLGSTFNIDASNSLTKETSSNSFGLELGYVFPSKSKLKTGLFIGAGMTNSKIELGLNSKDYYYETDADVDGDKYVRHYNDLYLAQTAKLSEVNVPFYLDFDYRFCKWASFYVDPGVRANFILTSKLDQAEGSAYIYGTYPAYNGLVLNEEWGFNGFGKKTYSKTDNVTDELDGIVKTTFDMLLGVGFRFNIPVVPLSVDLGLSYRKGLKEMTNSNRSDLGLVNNSNNPVVYNTISTDLGSTEHVRNLTDGLESIKRNALKLTMGIIYKF